MLADDVDAAGGAGDKGRGVAVGLLELLEEVVPSWALGGEGVWGVDVGEGVCDGDWPGHGDDVVDVRSLVMDSNLIIAKSYTTVVYRELVRQLKGEVV